MNFFFLYFKYKATVKKQSYIYFRLGVIRYTRRRWGLRQSPEGLQMGRYFSEDSKNKKSVNNFFELFLNLNFFSSQNTSNDEYFFHFFSTYYQFWNIFSYILLSGKISIYLLSIGISTKSDICVIKYNKKYLRVSEANEVPISSHIWVGLSTLNRL